VGVSSEGVGSKGVGSDGVGDTGVGAGIGAGIGAGFGASILGEQKLMDVTAADISVLSFSCFTFALLTGNI
jgi:hypothetical protein